jgi:NADH:ubiquinone oxidoreductase subunit 5 (subunit L)/multisubunit Na+/H+ antiporter MnhA subunit
MELLPTLLGWAVLLPLIAFAIVLIAGPRLGKGLGNGAYVSVAAILGAAVLSFVSLFIWLGAHWPESSSHHHSDTAHAAENQKQSRAPLSIQITPVSFVADHPTGDHPPGKETDSDQHKEKIPPHITGTYYVLGRFQDLEITISYYIDSLTIVMFCMVTLIASCIHFYAMGYMHDELHEIVDHEVTDSHGHHLHRPGRFWRFFQALSLFCFSMLGLVLAGNIAMVFCFWELVGICSYFLIGFYVERKSASNAANKAFIVNRVGDFGMIIGLMALWSSLGTFAFGDLPVVEDGKTIEVKPGLFSLVRSEENGYQVAPPDGMVIESSRKEVAAVVKELGPNATEKEIEDAIDAKVPEWRGDKTGARGHKNGYWLLIVAGVGIFCGCVGKSAQFPLHVWLPDAMEGPTPVSALVHSATMVAAGVYLVGRFFPVFCPEVLLVIAITGTITLFLAATIAITATDIKRVLAYSTVSQLGYMMMALGVGGWTAGLMHLITHAFFKSLLFMCSGSVIHAVHTNEMPKMGGLLKKMPITAITMLIGCLAIAGAGIPYVIGFSGYYSKDAILEQAYSFGYKNNSPYAWIFFFASAGGAAMTAFYMFRMWFLTFIGQPRDRERYDHAHESPPIMYVPLIILSVFAISVAWSLPHPNEARYAPMVFWPAAIGFVGVLFYLIYSSKPAAAPGHAAHDHDHDTHGHPAQGHDDHGAAQAEERHAVHPADEHHAHEHDDHAHAPPRIKWGTLITLAALLMLMGLTMPKQFEKLSSLNLRDLLEQSRPTGTMWASAKGPWVEMTWPAEHISHEYATLVTAIAFLTALSGVALAAATYWFGYVSADEVRRQFSGVYRLLWNKWYFDELYDFLFVRPTHVLSRFISAVDKNVLDRFIDGIAYCMKWFAVQFEMLADRTIVDGSVNLFAGWLYAMGLGLRRVQTGQLRQYVMFIVVGAVAVFLVISFFWNPTLAR